MHLGFNEFEPNAFEGRADSSNDLTNSLTEKHTLMMSPNEGENEKNRLCQ